MTRPSFHQYEKIWINELMSFAPHSRILQNWKPVSCFDRGTFSRIFEVVNEHTGQRAVLKYVPNPLDTADCSPGGTSEDDFHRSCFEASKREAEIMNRFHGRKHIVQYLEQPEYLRSTFLNERGEEVLQYAVLILMPFYISHRTWLSDIASSREEKLKLGLHIARALVTFEESGVYHRDLKPANIFLDHEGSYCLGDVGEAKLESEFTTVGFHGTRPYMAPEVYQQENGRTKMRWDHRADLYSLGIVLYRLFNRQQFPFLTAEGALTDEATHSYRRYEKKTFRGAAGPSSPGEQARLLRYAGEKLPPPAEADERLSRVILKACAYDKKNRFQTAEEMLRALEKCRDVYRPAPKPRGKKVLAVLAAAVAALAGIYGFLQKDGIQVEPVPEVTATVAVMPVQTSVVTATPEFTPEPTPEATATPEPTPEPTATPEPTPEPTATPEPTPEPTATPEPTPEPTATPEPTPEPTATPEPTPEPTATPTPLPVPKACTLSQSPMGILIRIPEPELSNVNDILIYRTTGADDWKRIAYLSGKERTYQDWYLEEGQTYHYCYQLVLKDDSTPFSQAATIRWTEVSKISNLRLWVPEGDVRTFCVDWDDIYEGEYDVSIQIDGPGSREEEWRWSGLPTNTTDFVYDWALPNTTYKVTVTVPRTGQSLVGRITTPQAPRYREYGAKITSSKIYWVSREDLNNNVPWEKARKTGYKPVSAEEMHEKLHDYRLDCKTDYTFSKSVPKREVEILSVLRSPSGKVANYSYVIVNNSFSGPSKWWRSEPMSNEMKKVTNNYMYIESGIYTYELYFNNCLLSTTTFEVKK